MTLACVLVLQIIPSYYLQINQGMINQILTIILLEPIPHIISAYVYTLCTYVYIYNEGMKV
jgi:hypothetical protein